MEGLSISGGWGKGMACCRVQENLFLSLQWALWPGESRRGWGDGNASCQKCWKMWVLESSLWLARRMGQRWGRRLLCGLSEDDASLGCKHGQAEWIPQDGEDSQSRSGSVMWPVEPPLPS